MILKLIWTWLARYSPLLSQSVSSPVLQPVPFTFPSIYKARQKTWKLYKSPKKTFFFPSLFHPISPFCPYRNLNIKYLPIYKAWQNKEIKRENLVTSPPAYKAKQKQHTMYRYINTEKKEWKPKEAVPFHEPPQRSRSIYKGGQDKKKKKYPI